MILSKEINSANLIDKDNNKKMAWNITDYFKYGFQNCFIQLIIAIIAIIVMGIFIYKLNNERTMEIQKSTELQSQINSLNGTINDLQGKITTISVSRCPACWGTLILIPLVHY